MSSPTVIAAAGPDFSVGIDELVELAVRAGYGRATTRTIRYWRSRGFISAPFHHHRQVRYPIQAVGEVDCLGRWPPRSYGVDLSMIARFVEVGTVPWDEARASFTRVLTRSAHELDDARARASDDPEILQREGAIAAARWGKKALPRVGRQPAADRARAHVHVLAGALGVEHDLQSQTVGQHAMESMFGLRSGRGGALRDLAGLVDSPFEVGFDPARALAILPTATNTAVEMARRLTEFLGLWYPLLLAPLRGIAPPAFLELALNSASRFTPEFYAIFFTHQLVDLVDMDPAKLAEALAEFESALGAGELYRELSAESAQKTRAALRPYPRLQLQLALSLTTQTRIVL